MTDDIDVQEEPTGPLCRHGLDLWDCSICGTAMYGGWNALRHCRQGYDWAEQDDPPSDGRGREEIGRG